MVILTTSKQVVRVGIATRANHVMHRAAIFIDAIPTQRVVSDRRHWAQLWEAGPQLLACGDVCAVQSACFARVEFFVKVISIPQVQIANLGPLNR